jgi:hypothetical protein
MFVWFHNPFPGASETESGPKHPIKGGLKCLGPSTALVCQGGIIQSQASIRHALSHVNPGVPNCRGGVGCGGFLGGSNAGWLKRAARKETVLAVGLTKTVEASHAEPSPNEPD